MQRSSAEISRQNWTGREEMVDSRLLFEGADFSRGRAGARLFRNPALQRRLLRLTSLIVIALVSIGLWIAAIWTPLAMLG
jgi:hypothetical protein